MPGRYETSANWPERVSTAFDLSDGLGEQTGSHFASIQGVGIGFPGPFSPRMPEPVFDSHGTPVSPSEYVRSSFRDRFRPGGLGATVLIDNNTRFAGLGEAIWGSGANVANLVYVRLADGVGGGLVVGGRLVTGSAGFAGELGHIAVQPDGMDCRCGKRGCLETIASVPAILTECALRGVPVASLAELGEAAAKSDPVVDRVLRDAGAALGRVLGMLAVALNPSEVVVGGELVHLAPALLSQAESALSWELLPVPDIAPRIRAAALGDDDGALGAVAALFHQSALLDNYPSAAAAESALSGSRPSVL